MDLFISLKNTNDWTEDLFEDLKFKIHRAKFDISRTASLLLTNEELGYEKLDVDPIETNAEANTGATSSLFKNIISRLKLTTLIMDLKILENHMYSSNQQLMLVELLQLN